MIRSVPRRGVAALCSAAVVLAVPWPAVAKEQVIRCSSHNLRYHHCRVDTDGRAELVQKHSLFSCHQGRSWGFDPHGVWVDRGCSADFKVGKRFGDREKAVAAGVVGLAAIAAIAASRQQEAPQEVAAWAVGSFRGQDPRERVTVDLTILPGGDVTGTAGGHALTGHLAGDRLDAGRQRFRIAREGNGFVAVDVGDAGHRVVFQRLPTGY